MKLFRRKRSRRRSSRRATTDPKKMLIRQVFVGLAVFSGATLLVAGVWYGSRIDSLQVREVRVIGGSTISHEVVRNKVNEQLVGTYYKLIPRRFQSLYPEIDIISQLQQIPRIQEVRIDDSERGVLTVIFTEYEPYALWCGDVTTGEASCVFIDHTGYAFAPAPQLNGNAFVRYMVPEVSPQVGQRVTERAMVAATQRFIDQVKTELDVYVTGVELISDIDTVYQLAGGAWLNTSNRLSVEETVTNLITIFSNESFAHLADGDFNYIDLRFGDKVYVSEEEWVPEVASSTATSSMTMETEEEGE